jgi:hypothetical protein
MDDDPAAPLTGPSGRAPVQPGSTSGGGAIRRRQAWRTWPVIVPLLGIPAFIAATFVSSLVPSPPDFCGQPLGPTCQQADAQIIAMRMAAGATLALWVGL